MDKGKAKAFYPISLPNIPIFQYSIIPMFS
jgi:hypothetical protein